jgi:hypothetical protein
MQFIYLFQFLSNFIYICFLNISLKGLYVGIANLQQKILHLVACQIGHVTKLVMCQIWQITNTFSDVAKRIRP